MPSLRAGQTVTFTHRVVIGVDEYGNDVYGSTNVAVTGCAISPGNSTEVFQGTEQITADITVHAPYGTLVDLPLDEMTTPDGVTYNIIGQPKTWTSPFTGTLSMLEVLGRLVSTGGAAT